MSEAAPHPIGGRAHSGLWTRVATEHALATDALALIAVRVAGDTFVRPQPGTSPTDHLVSGPFEVERAGIEPATSGLQSRRSPS
jgi:hypothetical protein